MDCSLVVPSREQLDNVRRLMAGDEYIGRGCRQRELPRSRFCNPFKVSEFGRELAMNLIEQTQIRQTSCHVGWEVTAMPLLEGPELSR